MRTTYLTKEKIKCLATELFDEYLKIKPEQFQCMLWICELPLSNVNKDSRFNGLLGI